MATRHRTVAWAKDPEVSRLAAELTAAREDLARRVVRGPGADPPERYKSLVLQRSRAKGPSRTKPRREESRFSQRAVTESGEPGRRESGPSAGRRAGGVCPLSPPSVGRAKAGREISVVDSVVPGAGLAQRRERSRRGAAGHRRKRSTRWCPRWQEQIGQEALAPGRASRRTEATYRLTATELRQKVWDPVAPHLKGAKSVFLVPDGSLQLVNFAALPMGETSYLIETGPRHSLPVSRARPGADGTDNANGGLLALGSPAFDDTGCFCGAETGTAAEHRSRRVRRSAETVLTARTFESMRFAPLPDSAREAQDIVALWKKTNKFIPPRRPGPLSEWAGRDGRRVQA